MLDATSPSRIPLRFRPAATTPGPIATLTETQTQTPGPVATRTGTLTPTSADRHRRRVSLFLHEPLESARTSELRAGIIADGTTRGGPNGIAEGARRVVECAERCAVRGDVGILAVFVLSPKNLTRRKGPFFAALHAEFLRLLEGVVSGRVLVGIRVEIHGRLDRLRRRGGAAARLADVAELLEEATRGLPAPRMCLALCLDYAEDAPVVLDLDLLIRTGMEGPSVLRLSGLRVRPDTICIPSMKLWREFGAPDLDEALRGVSAAPKKQLSRGFSGAFVEALLGELSGADISSDVRLTVPVSASREEVSAALERAAPGLLARSSAVSVTPPPGLWRSIRRIGPREAPVQVRLVRAEEGAAVVPGAAVGWIAPGQSSSALRLLERSVGDANIHTCEATARGVVEGIRRALAFDEAHPLLHGAPRAPGGGGGGGRDGGEKERLVGLLRLVGARAGAAPEVVARELSGGREPAMGVVGEVFAASCLLDARSAGLMSGEVEWDRQALGYGLTAFAIGFSPGGPEEADRPWETKARALARVMLALAASDEEISDRVFEGERENERRARLQVSGEYLIGAIRGEPLAAPRVAGAEVLRSIALIWRGFFAHVARGADEALVAGARQSAAALYRANLAELSAEPGLFAALSRSPAEGSVEDLVALHAADAPGPIVRRIRELLGETRAEVSPQTPGVWRELRLLCRLLQVAPSIGAGCALLAMTATEPARSMPEEALEPLLRTASLVDCYFRLANDLAFTDVTRGDRDDKPTTFTCLLPPRLLGKAREQACVEALQTCLTTARWLHAEVERGLATLREVWPAAARWWERGIHFGRRVYEGGHYDRLTREAVASILSEVAALGAAPTGEKGSEGREGADARRAGAAISCGPEPS